MNPDLRKRIQKHLEWTPGTDATTKLAFLVLGLSGEVGELANLVKKHWRGDDVPNLGIKIMEEVADVGGYLHMIAEHLGVDVEELMSKKLDEVEQRPAWKKWEREHA